MRTNQGFSFNGLIFNNEMAYETISEIEGELVSRFYNDNIRLFYNKYKERMEDYYQYIKKLINGITSKLKVVEIEARNFVKHFPGVVRLIHCGGESRDSKSRQYEKDLPKLFCNKVEIIFKND